MDSIFRCSADPWSHYEFKNSDARDIVVANGRGRITERTLLGARVELESMRAGERVLLRTHFFPAWTAWFEAQQIPLIDSDGQIALLAPRDGSLTIEMRYQKRTWLLFVAIAAVVIGSAVLALEHRR